MIGTSPSCDIDDMVRDSAGALRLWQTVARSYHVGLAPVFKPIHRQPRRHFIADVHSAAKQLSNSCRLRLASSSLRRGNFATVHPVYGNICQHVDLCCGNTARNPWSWVTPKQRRLGRYCVTVSASSTRSERVFSTSSISMCRLPQHITVLSVQGFPSNAPSSRSY